MPEPTYAELSAEFGKLLDEREEWRRNIREMGAEIEQLHKDAAIADEHIERSNDETMKAYRHLRTLRGQVVTLLGLCEGLKRFEGYDPATAYVTVHEIETIFDVFDRDGDAPVAEGADHGA